MNGEKRTQYQFGISQLDWPSLSGTIFLERKMMEVLKDLGGRRDCDNTEEEDKGIVQKLMVPLPLFS